ncbi:LysE family translocator [Oxalobacteraceae bacterium OM1]|nr:LysE family translocator [Oxalobacteraceae bacterium OM1]
MDIHTVLTFAVVAGLTIITPGPAILLSIRNGSSFGVRSVFWSAFGNVCGVFCLSAAAMCGLGVVMKSSIVVFGALKLVGAGYLLYLGVRSLRSGTKSLSLAGTDHAENLPSRGQLFVEAFLTAATNPKALLFFTALFPQFIHADQPLINQFLILTGVFMTLAYITHLVYATAASRARAALQRPALAMWLNRMMGATFITFAVALITFRRPTA